MENIKISYAEKKEESEDAVENIFAIFIAFFAYGINPCLCNI